MGDGGANFVTFLHLGVSTYKQVCRFVLWPEMREQLALLFIPHLGFTECVQFFFFILQLRGLADRRQVEGAKLGLQQNFGIGGAAVVTLYKKHSQALTAKL